MFYITSFLTLLVVAAWLVGLWLDPPAFNARAYMHEALYVTGLVAWLWFALCLVIAARPAWIEKLTRTSLDRLYVFHKRLGFAAVALAFIHFFGKSLFGPLMRAIWDLPRGGKPQLPPPQDWMEQLWRSARPVAEISAEAVVWVALALALMALIKKLPYKTWLAWHRLFAVGAIVLALHAIRLPSSTEWAMPFGWLNAVVTALALWASVMILLKGPGWQRRTCGTVVENQRIGKDICRLKIKADLVSEPGQFAFLRLSGEAHPFSIADNKAGVLTFYIKALGDFTREAPELAPVGTAVELEGPWGRFNPTFIARRQAWCAAGIGIAPFIAWLEQATQAPHEDIRLFWCVKNAEEEPLAPLIKALSEKARVRLHMIDGSMPPLRAQTVLEGLPEIIAFCGATELLQSTRREAPEDVEIMNEVFTWR